MFLLDMGRYLPRTPPSWCVYEYLLVLGWFKFYSYIVLVKSHCVINKDTLKSGLCELSIVLSKWL